jgi:Tripartite tricarboxylate transporter family receptor
MRASGARVKLSRRQFLHLAATAVALPAQPRFASAQAYPSRRITLVVPFAAGALTDSIARVLAEGMRTSLGQPIIVENVAGADGTIGTGRVAHASPDGYTLVLGVWNTHVTNAAIYALEYDVVKDFEPIVLLPDAPMVLIAKKTIPANNLHEFITWPGLIMQENGAAKNPINKPVRVVSRMGSTSDPLDDDDECDDGNEKNPVHHRHRRPSLAL